MNKSIVFLIAFFLVIGCSRKAGDDSKDSETSKVSAKREMRTQDQLRGMKLVSEDSLTHLSLSSHDALIIPPEIMVNIPHTITVDLIHYLDQSFAVTYSKNDGMIKVWNLVQERLIYEYSIPGEEVKEIFNIKMTIFLKTLSSFYRIDLDEDKISKIYSVGGSSTSNTIITPEFILFVMKERRFQDVVIYYDYKRSELKVPQSFKVCGACFTAVVYYVNERFYFAEDLEYGNLLVYDRDFNFIGDLPRTEVDLKPYPNVVQITRLGDSLDFSRISKEFYQSMISGIEFSDIGDKLKDKLPRIWNGYYIVEELEGDHLNGDVLFYLRNERTREFKLILKEGYWTGAYNYGRYEWAFIYDGLIAIREEAGITPISRCYKVFDFYGNVLGETDMNKANRLLVPVNNNLFLVRNDGSVVVYDMNMKVQSVLEGTGRITDIEASDNMVTTSSIHNTKKMWNLSTGKLFATKYEFNDGSDIIITPEGYFTGQGSYSKYLHIVYDHEAIPIDRYFEIFYRPDLVTFALSGGSLANLTKIQNVLLSPSISFARTSMYTNKQTIPITLEIVDNGGGVGDIRVYLNGVAIVLDSEAGHLSEGRKVFYKTYSINLLNGVNNIRSVAFNGDNTLQSEDASIDIIASFETTRKPSLHVLIFGINEYKNPKLTLEYAVADAESFAQVLYRRTIGLFDKVDIRKFTQKQTTTKDFIINELKSMQKLSANDVFLLYISSHGIVDDGVYYLIPSNVGLTSTHILKEDAISQNILKKLISNIPATKKLLFFDTCGAEALGKSIQIALLTRGMSEDVAMKVLSRAIGTTILSAATSNQDALEGYNGHGIFSYVVIQGLKGDADLDKDGFIQTTELANYVGETVPLIAERAFQRPQYPVISISGQVFPIATVK